MGLPEASRRTGRARMTLERWIDNGWLRTEEVRDGRGVRHFVTLEAIREAEETAMHAPRRAVSLWREKGGVERTVPRANAPEYAALGRWFRKHGKVVLQ